MRADPRVRQLGVLVLASEEVKKIHGETGQHQNLQVEALPVGSQVQWHLRMYVHVYGNTVTTCSCTVDTQAYEGKAVD